MSQDVHPWRFLSATVGVGILTEGWNLSVPCGEEDEARSFTLEVSFDLPFQWAPLVHLGLTGFDIDGDSSARMTLVAESITPGGFLVRIATWRSTRVYAAEFSWLAVGA